MTGRGLEKGALTSLGRSRARQPWAGRAASKVGLLGHRREAGDEQRPCPEGPWSAEAIPRGLGCLGL